MKCLILIISGLFLFQCTPQQPAKKQETNPAITPNDKVAVQVPESPADTKKFAVQILEEKIKLSDDGPVEACLDSLYSGDPAVRNFYWKVLRVILRDSDGAISEMLSPRLVQLLKHDPGEFATQYQAFDLKIRSNCCSLMAYGLFMNATSEKEVTKIFKNYKDQCKTCTPAQLATLDNICGEIKEGISWYLNNSQ